MAIRIPNNANSRFCSKAKMVRTFLVFFIGLSCIYLSASNLNEMSATSSMLLLPTASFLGVQQQEQNNSSRVMSGLDSFSNPQGSDNKNRRHKHLTKVHEYRTRRHLQFDTWFQPPGTSVLRENADENGTILDFAVVGMAKCGTTTVMDNLRALAPMPLGDICTPVHQTVWYAYKLWPPKFSGGEMNITNKVLRGTKCPQFAHLHEYSKYLPRTKLIVGIRHPVLWFQSFWNMQAGKLPTRGITPYNLTRPCSGLFCRVDCPPRTLFCVQRGAFHVQLARLGKTALSLEERQLLSFHTYPHGGGMNVQNLHIRNHVFLYEQSELGDDYIWEAMAEYLQVPHIANAKYHGTHGRNDKFNICQAPYDMLRAQIMKESYDLARWLEEYFIPVAQDPTRLDVTIPQPARFRQAIQMYKKDPCHRLVRVESTGIFELPNEVDSSSQ